MMFSSIPRDQKSAERILGMLVLLALLISPSLLAGIDIHVATDGKDNRDGSLSTPVATLTRALELVRAEESKLGTNRIPATITLHEGTYFPTNSVELNADDSGTPSAPLVIRGDQPGKVVLHGGIRFGSESLSRVTDPSVLARVPESAREKIWSLDLKSHGITDYGELKKHGFATHVQPSEMELFVDGQPWHLARYPNHGILKIGRILDKGSVPRNGDNSNRGATFIYEGDEHPSKWAKIHDVWIGGRFNYGFADDNLKISSIDPVAYTITLLQPHLYGVKSSIYPEAKKASKGNADADPGLGDGASMRGYYAYNLLEELDAPGEYYIDREKGVLYLYGETNPIHQTLDLSLQTKPFLSLHHLHDVTIEGLSFECSRGMGIYQENTDHVSVNGCSFLNLGTVAISMGEKFDGVKTERNPDGSPLAAHPDSTKFHDNSVLNCVVGNNGTGGVFVAGGDRKILLSGQNSVRNCEFFGNSRRNETYAPSVTLLGVGSRISQCYFHDQRHESIHYQGNNFLIERNLFARDCQDADDMGVLYTGRDPSARGTLIKRNFFTDILPPTPQTKMCAIYMDDGSGGITVEQNIFARCCNPGVKGKFGAIFLNGGHDNLVKENLFIECPMAIGHNSWNDKRWAKFLSSEMMQQRLGKEVNISSSVYLKTYPELADYYTNHRARLNTVQGNLLYDTPLTMIGDYSLSDNRVLPLDGSRNEGSWTLPAVASKFSKEPLVQEILSQPIGLDRKEFDRWHPDGPQGKD